MHRFKNAGGEDGGEEEETNTTTNNNKNDNTNNNNAAPGKVNVSASPSEKIINYAYRHGMSGKELKKRAKELKKRQMLERETKRLERRERRNSATTTSQVEEEEEEETFFNSATIPIPAMSEYAFSPSSASPTWVTILFSRGLLCRFRRCIQQVLIVTKAIKKSRSKGTRRLRWMKVGRITSPRRNINKIGNS